MSGDRHVGDLLEPVGVVGHRPDLRHGSRGQVTAVAGSWNLVTVDFGRSGRSALLGTDKLRLVARAELPLGEGAG